ncbi:MAG: diacylglycerol kinase [Actinobacteria bacterium]|nr:MAG: diacylglycerol kinase [Actinomycetota bacterium]
MRVLIVKNPRAGRGDAGLFDFVNMLGSEGAEVVVRYLTGERDVARAVDDADAFDRVVAAGGDGTVSAVAYALRSSGVPVLAFPAGTANLIASNLGLSADPRALANLALEGEDAPVDVGELEYHELMPEGLGPARTTGFVMAAGAGFDARVIDGARDLKAALGPAAYLVAALRNLTPTVARFHMRLDGRDVETEGIAVMLANFAQLQFEISVAHRSDPRDGKADVVVLATRTVPELLPAVWAGFLDGTVDLPHRPGVELHTASEIELVAEPALPLQADGESLGAHTPLTARMLPHAARFIVPSGSRLLEG